MCSERRAWVVAAGVAFLAACAASSGERDLAAAIDAVEPSCGDTASSTPILIRGTFPVLVRVSISDPARNEIDATYRVWLEDVELAGVVRRDAHSLTATVPASFAAGAYPLSLQSPYGDRVTAEGAFEIRQGGCSGPPGALAIAASAAPNAVTVGQQVTVTAAVRNTGQRPLFDVAAAVSTTPGGAVLVGSQGSPQDLAGGGTGTFTWTYRMTQTTGVEGGSFGLTAAGRDGTGEAVSAPPASTNALLVNPPANVTAHTQAPPSVNVNQVITVTLVATNTGAAPALVAAAMTASAGTATVTSLSSPVPQTVPGGGERSLVWTFQVNASSDATFSVGVTATDLNSGQALTVAPTPPVTVEVQRRAALETTIDVPAAVSAGQAVTVTATVTNTGEATASGVSASVSAAPAMFTRLTGPGPHETLAGGASATFAWTYRAEVGATVGVFAVAAAGTDANDGQAVAAPGATSSQVAAAYTVGGMVTGLGGTGLVLRNRGEDLPVSGDGAFVFANPVPSGGAYSVTVAAQPAGLVCVPTNASGTVVSSPVTSVAVSCTTELHALTTSVLPADAGTVSCDGHPCQQSYPYGTVPIELTAEAAPGYTFVSWSGACTGTGACSVTMVEDRTVIANFAVTRYTLSITITPSVAGTVECGGAPCEASYLHSTVPMEITATPSPFFRFESWRGDCRGQGQCFVTMDQDRSVEAEFRLESP